MNKLYTAFMYTTTIKNNTNGKTFNKWHLSFKGHTFDLSMWEEMEAQLITDMKKQGLKTPLNISFGEDDYYTKTKTFTKKDGSTGSKIVITLVNYNSIEQAQYTKKTLDDIVESTTLKKDDILDA